MDTLPEEILEMVFCNLDLEDLLFATRLVCQSWRDIICSRNGVWAKQVVSDSYWDKRHTPMYALASRIARHIGTVEIVEYSPRNDLDLRNLPCSALGLDLVLYSNPHYAQAVMQNLVEKNRVQRIKLEIHCLESECVWFLRCALNIPRLNSSIPQMSLLPACMNLQSVTLPPSLQLEELLKCNSLTDLTLLKVFLPNEPEYPELKDKLIRYFGKAAGLRTITLLYCTNDPRSFEIILDVLQSLSSCKESDLRCVTLDEIVEEATHSSLLHMLSGMTKNPQLQILP